MERDEGAVQARAVILEDGWENSGGQTSDLWF